MLSSLRLQAIGAPASDNGGRLYSPMPSKNSFTRAKKPVDAGLVLGFEAVDEWHPRLIAFRRLEEGQWRVIASANFVNVKAVPAGVECVAAG